MSAMTSAAKPRRPPIVEEQRRRQRDDHDERGQAQTFSQNAHASRTPSSR